MVATQINNPRINSKRVIGIILYTLVLPIVIAVGVDLVLGWQPIVTMIAGLILIPLSSVLVIRAILAEIDHVIEQVAPIELENQKSDIS